MRIHHHLVAALRSLVDNIHARARAQRLSRLRERLAVDLHINIVRAFLRRQSSRDKQGSTAGLDFENHSWPMLSGESHIAIGPVPQAKAVL